MDVNIKFVCLEGLEFRNKFITSFKSGDADPTLSAKGERWYRIIGYAETIWQAQAILYGTKEADRVEFENATLVRRSKVV